MHMVDLIEKKRNGNALSKEELEYWIDGCTAGRIPDYQSSALLMAIFFQGLTEEETLHLTLAMAASGEQMDLSSLGSHTVDKHSTGGVGDKTTLIAAPIAAAAGCTIAKMSGRGLGHTGGTVDKLESIPGFETSLSPNEFLRVAEKTGLCVVGQTGNLAPADKKLYALRDVTATVENLSLIAASIMSKKLAAGNQAIILDVKTGSGAFMKTLDGSRALAKAMVDIGNRAGRVTRAVITNMDIPLGFAVGNALEVEEAVDTLRGNGPKDLTEVCLTLSSVMIACALQKPLKDSRRLAEKMLQNGRAYNVFLSMVRAQGGDADILEKRRRALFSKDIQSPGSGYVAKINTAQCGRASVLLGAGRETKEDCIDPLAGILLHKKTGDSVKKGDSLATFYASEQSLFAEAESAFLKAYTISGQAPAAEPLIFEIIE